MTWDNDQYNAVAYAHEKRAREKLEGQLAVAERVKTALEERVADLLVERLQTAEHEQNLAERNATQAQTINALCSEKRALHAENLGLKVDAECRARADAQETSRKNWVDGLFGLAFMAWMMASPVIFNPLPSPAVLIPMMISVVYLAGRHWAEGSLDWRRQNDETDND
jgi:hypothetical protein